jgi:hypothetical protein
MPIHGDEGNHVRHQQKNAIRCAAKSQSIPVSSPWHNFSQRLQHMKSLFLIFTLTVCLLRAEAQTYVYPNQFKYFSEIMFSVIDGNIIPGRSIMWSDAVLTARNNRVFKGFSTSTFDVMYTLEDGKVYIGDSNFFSDLIYTIKNGKVYKGDSTYMMDCLFTYDLSSNTLYKGDSKFALDAVLFFQGDTMTNAELLALLLAAHLL